MNLSNLWSDFKNLFKTEEYVPNLHDVRKLTVLLETTDGKRFETDVYGQGFYGQPVPAYEQLKFWLKDPAAVFSTVDEIGRMIFYNRNSIVSCTIIKEEEHIIDVGYFDW